MSEDFCMTEEEAREALFKLNFEYMSNPPRERDKLYEKYAEERAKIRHALARAKLKKMQEEESNKKL